MPVVSVVMPLYNEEAYLEEALSSIGRQSVQDYELIIVDDGSTDRSLEIIEELKPTLNHCQVFTQRRSYAGTARNRGMDYATGKYVLFLDSDDVFDSNLFEMVINRMDDTNADACVFGGRRFRNSIGDIDEKFSYLRSDLLPEQDTFTFADAPRVFFQITNPTAWTKAFRLDFVRDTGIRFQHHENANDLFFTYANLVSARSICAVQDNLVWYRKHEGSSQLSTKSQPLAFLNALVCLKALLIRRDCYDLLEESFLKLALANFDYNVRTAKKNGDVRSYDLLSQAYKDYAAFELGLLKSSSEMSKLISGNYSKIYERLNRL